MLRHHHQLNVLTGYRSSGLQDFGEYGCGVDGLIPNPGIELMHIADSRAGAV
jgi:hypothetical protein